MPLQIINDDCLPSEYKNVICKDKSVGKKTLVRSNLKNIEEINNWVKLFGRKTNTCWTASATIRTKTSKVYWRKFVCHHDSLRNVHSKKNKEKLAKPCKASILIVMKADHNPVRKNDENIKNGLQAIIRIECEHNHSLEITNDQYLQSTSVRGNGCSENILSQANSATELCDDEPSIINIDEQNTEKRCGGKTRSTDEYLTVPSKRGKRSKYVRKERTIKVEVTSSSGRSVVGSFSSSRPFGKISKNMVNNIIPLIQGGVLLAEESSKGRERGATTVGSALPSVFQVTPCNSETSETESEESDLQTTIYLDPDRFDKVESATRGGEESSKLAFKDVQFRIDRKEQRVRYFGDIKYEHIEDPEKRVQCWQIIQKTYSEKMQHIKSLRDTLRSLKEQFYELKDEIDLA